MKTVQLLLTAAAIAIGLAVSTPAQSSSDDGMGRVVAAMQAGDNARTAAELDAVIKLHPDLVGAFLLRSTLRAASGDRAGALADCNRVIELQPGLGAAYYERAMLRLPDQDVSGALKDLDLAIANNYQGDFVYDIRSMVRNTLGDDKGALEDLDQAIKLNPNNPEFYPRRAELLLKLSQIDRALADLTYLLHWYETDPVMRPVPKTAGQEQKPLAGPSSNGAETCGAKASRQGSVDVWGTSRNRQPFAGGPGRDSPGGRRLYPSRPDL